MFPHFVDPSPDGAQREWFFPAPRCLRPHLEDLGNRGWLDGWNLKPRRSIITHPWLLTGCTGGAVGCSPQLHVAWASPQYGDLRVVDLTFNNLHWEDTELLPAHSIAFHWVIRLSGFKGRKKRQKTQILLSVGVVSKDYCGHYFKPSKDSSNNFLKWLLKQSCFNDIFFYYSQYSRCYFH